MIPPSSGTFLIADPFLKDPHFQRTVILLCEHNDEGSFGLVVNRLLPLRLCDLLSDIKNTNFPVYYGGPVDTNTLHILHRSPELLPDSQSLQKNIFWGGPIETITELINRNVLNHENIRFFLGYSGWGEGQLSNELKEETWITGKGNADLVFMEEPKNCWKKALQTLGEPYNQMALYPLDPQLN
jgi:putative transcriptional regulator